jgi:hypothetical protein
LLSFAMPDYLFDIHLLPLAVFLRLEFIGLQGEDWSGLLLVLFDVFFKFDPVPHGDVLPLIDLLLCASGEQFEGGDSLLNQFLLDCFHFVVD